MGQHAACGIQLFQRSARRCCGYLRRHLGEAVACVDWQSAGEGLIYEVGGDRSSPEQNSLEPVQVGVLTQQPQELGWDEGGVCGTEGGDGVSKRLGGVGERDRHSCEQTPEQYGETTNVVEGQRVQPQVPRRQSDVDVGSQGAMVVVAEGVQCGLEYA